MIVDYRDLAWRYPEISQHTYTTDKLGLPWFTMASLIIRAMMDRNVGPQALRRIALEIFDHLDWPLPEESRVQEMASLLQDMIQRTVEFIRTGDQYTRWVAVNVRAPTTVIFYALKDEYRNPHFAHTGAAL